MSASVYTLSASSAVFLVLSTLLRASDIPVRGRCLYGTFGAPVTFVSPISGRLSDKIGSTYLFCGRDVGNLPCSICLSRLSVGSTFLP
jgi:hypothetical protein